MQASSPCFSQKEQAQRGRELLAFVDSGEVNDVLPKTLCNEDPLEKSARSRCGIGLRGANGSHIKHHQQCFRVKTSAGSNMITTWEVADVRQPLISASRLFERTHKLVLEKPRVQSKSGDIIALEGCGSLFAVRLWIPEVFSRQR